MSYIEIAASSLEKVWMDMRNSLTDEEKTALEGMVVAFPCFDCDKSMGVY